MGNIIWSCDNCKTPNFGENAVCVKCLYNRHTGMLTAPMANPRNNGILSSATAKPPVPAKSDLVRIHLANQVRARQARPGAPTGYYPLDSSETYTSDHFVDADFPPAKQSLYMNGSRIKRSNLLHSTGFIQVKKWVRPVDLHIASADRDLPITLFSEPTPKDVIQGELGTCWFLSALALLAEKPFLLLNSMVTNKFYNPNGLHQFRLCRRGEWVIVSIDDYLPVDRRRRLVFSLGRRRQLWVPFMEKALAKLYGSYEAVAKGACAEGLQILTGEPCEVLYLSTGESSNKTKPNKYDDPYTVWQKILHSHRLGYLMTTLCHKEYIKSITLEAVGLLNRHVYSILDAREFDDIKGEPVQLLRLRNPWGHKEWNGAWSTGWSHWPEHIKDQMQMSVFQKNDGCFWISFDDVLKYFYDITICKVRANWTESRHTSFFYDYSKNAEVYMLSVTDPGVHEFEVELFATGRREEGFDRNADPDIDLCLVICRVTDPNTGGGLTCLAFAHSVEYYITATASLTPGYYMVFATSIKAVSPEHGFVATEMYGQQPNLFSYNIIFHCQSPFSLNRVMLPAEIIADTFYSVALFQNKVKYEFDGAVRSYIVAGTCTHLVLLENVSHYLVRSHVDTSYSKNLESTRFAHNTSNYLYPGNRQFLICLTPINYRTGYVIGYKMDTRIMQYAEDMNYPEVPVEYAGLHAVRGSYW